MGSGNELIKPPQSSELDLPRQAWPDKQIKELAASIRQYYLDRVDLLRQIPVLALEADGRSGWLGAFRRAYEECYYIVFRGAKNKVGQVVAVELRTGLLVDMAVYTDHLAEMFPDQNIPWLAGMRIASDADVVKLAGEVDSRDYDEDGGDLLPRDLERFIADLKEWGKEPYAKYENPEKHEAIKVPFRVKLDKLMREIPLQRS